MPGGWLVNIAGVVEIARTGGTLKSTAFYEAFVIAYERVAALPMTDIAKQKAAFEEARVVAGLPEITDIESPSAI